MQPFSEVPIKPDVTGTSELPEKNVDLPDETEGWKNSIELPDDTGEWVDSIELPDDPDGWQDSINVDSFDDVHRNGDEVEDAAVSGTGADAPVRMCPEQEDDQRDQTDRAAEHPRAIAAHLGVGAVGQGADHRVIDGVPDPADQNRMETAPAGMRATSVMKKARYELTSIHGRL